MLNRLISTRPTRVGRNDALLLSIAAHVVVIVAMISQKTTSSWSTGEVTSTRHAVEHIQYFVNVPAPPPRTAAPSRVPTRAPTAAPAVKPLVPALRASSIGPIAIAEVPKIPDDVGPSVKISDSLDFQPVRLAEAIGGGVNRGAVNGIVNRAAGGAKTGPYAADQVDKIVRPLSNNPKPVYPRVLQSQGVEGSFVVHFVVDSTGRVDERSMEFPSDAHTLFVDSVRRALKRSRYQPAEIAGQAVTQLVEQRFTFILTR